eukprot:2980905-Rhodomonas_salina.2
MLLQDRRARGQRGAECRDLADICPNCLESDSNSSCLGPEVLETDSDSRCLGGFRVRGDVSLHVEPRDRAETQP